MRLIRHIPHNVSPITCMWNGIEDQYEWKTGVRVPYLLFFCLSGIANFAYISQRKSPAMVYWSNGITKRMYDFMKKIVGFSYSVTENRSFQYTIQKAIKQINQGKPVILGALDMYHLPYYEKFYHVAHIPIHYIMMIGYDDKGVHVLDCDREGIQHILYEDLEAAWNVHTPGFSKKNTIYTINFSSKIQDLRSIVYKGLEKKCKQNLYPPVKFLGIPGIRKLIKEFPLWGEKLGQNYKPSLMHLVEYTGFPPSLPPRILLQQGIDVEDTPDNHRAARDVLASLLVKLSDEYNEPAWLKASATFAKSGELLSEMTTNVTEYLLTDIRDHLLYVPELLKEVANLEEQAYITLKRS